MTRKKQSIITKKIYIKEAMILIKENGFEKTGIKEICEKAGVTTEAFYHYYDSKIDLLLEIHNEIDILCSNNLTLVQSKNPEKK